MTVDLGSVSNRELVTVLTKRGMVIDDFQNLNSLRQFQRDLITDLKGFLPFEIGKASERITGDSARIVAEKHNPEGTVDSIILNIEFREQDRTATITPGVLQYQVGEKSWIDLTEQRDGSMSQEAAYGDMLELQKRLIEEIASFGKSKGVDFTVEGIDLTKIENKPPLTIDRVPPERMFGAVNEHMEKFIASNVVCLQGGARFEPDDGKTCGFIIDWPLPHGAGIENTGVTQEVNIDLSDGVAIMETDSPKFYVNDGKEGPIRDSDLLTPELAARIDNSASVIAKELAVFLARCSYEVQQETWKPDLFSKVAEHGAPAPVTDMAAYKWDHGLHMPPEQARRFVHFVADEPEEEVVADIKPDQPTVPHRGRRPAVSKASEPSTGRSQGPTHGL